MHKIDTLQHYCKGILATKKSPENQPLSIYSILIHTSQIATTRLKKFIVWMLFVLGKKKKLLDYQITESSSFHFSHATLPCLYFSPRL